MRFSKSGLESMKFVMECDTKFDGLLRFIEHRTLVAEFDVQE